MAATTGALLIHGLGGTQFDLGSMHKTLKRAGVETHSLTLPGHGGQPEDLLQVMAEDWIDAVRTKYREVAGQYDTFHVMGMCMGSLLALNVCQEEQHRHGKLIALAPPIYIDGWATPWYARLRHMLYWLPLVPERMRVEEEDPFGIKNELVRAIVKAKFERGENFHYRWVPLACVREVDRLRRQVMRGASRIGCPTLVVHAREDELTSLRSADFLEATIPQCEKTVLENSYHMICVDNDREKVASSVLTFLGFDATEVLKRPARVETDVPMSADEVVATAQAYFEAMRAQRFESLFPMFASDVRWEQGGHGPVAGVYEERSQLIDLFSRLMSHSGSTFAVTAFGEPRYEEQTLEVAIHFQAIHGGQTLQASGVQRLRLRNQRIATVVYLPDDPDAEALLWQASAASPGDAGAPVAPAANQPVSDAVQAIPDADLPAAFEAAAAAVKALPTRPSNAVLLQLYGLYKQGSEGDATGARPGFTDPVGRAKHDAWSALTGRDRATAQRQYITLVESLRT